MIIPVVAGCCIWEGKVLLQTRKLERRNREFLNLPGGKIEPGEQPVEALAREFREELGVAGIGARLAHAQVNEYEGDEDSYLVLFYEMVLVDASQVSAVDHNGNDLRWIPLGEVERENTLPGTLETIAECDL